MEPLVVRLRPFEEGDLWFFDRAAKEREFSAPFEWSGFSSPESRRRRWREEGLLGATPYCLAVAAVHDDSLVGLVDWGQNERWGAGVWEIGAMIVPEYRGRGAGTEAQRQLVDYLFSTTACNRVWAGTEVENIAEQRALEGAGLVREGCVRGQHFRDGRWRDSYIYGITRNDWNGDRLPPGPDSWPRRTRTERRFTPPPAEGSPPGTARGQPGYVSGNDAEYRGWPRPLPPDRGPSRRRLPSLLEMAASGLWR